MNRAEMETSCLELLVAKEPLAAANLWVDFEAAQNEPRGLNMDWRTDYVRARCQREIVGCFEKRPAILGHQTQEVFHALGVRAAMLEICGTSSLPKRMNLPPILIGNMKGHAAARMIRFSVCNDLDFESWRSVATHYELLAAPDSCAECTSLKGGLYAFEDVCPVPHTTCTHKMGCRCSPSPIIPEI